jgi:CheY-like chemotaxis protein
MPARILIVEDDQIIAADLRLKVERLGHAVVGMASAGEEAIGLAGQLKPEIVLMDIQLEEAMSGTEAARIIQERTGAAIVFVTAFSGAAFREASTRTPDRGVYLGKPFSQVQLEQALDTALQNRL